MSYFGIPIRNGVSIGLGSTVSLASQGLLAPSLSLNFTSGVLDPRVTFTRASTGTYFNSAGVLTSAAINEARFDYNPTTLVALGLMVETSRTNLVLNSDALITQNVTVTAVANTLSFYGTGTVVISGTGTGTLVGSGAFPTRSSLTFTPTAGVVTLTVTGTVTKAQLEAGAFATSYIPTTAATVTRATDVASITTVTPWYNATEGTLYVSGQLIGGAPSTFPYVTSLVGANANTDSIGIAWTANSSLMRFGIRVGGVTSADIPAGSAKSAGSAYKVAGRYALNNFQAAFDGVLGVADTAGTVPTITALSLGGSVAFQVVANTYFRYVAYYPRQFSNAQLQALTV